MCIMELHKGRLQGLVMDFTVHVDVKEDIGSMIIREPTKVEWSVMVDHLSPHGFKGNADLYYLEPGCVPPNGLVLMSGPEHVEQMMLAHKGRKKCDLYIMKNGPPSDDSADGMSEEGQFSEDIDSWEPTEEGKWDVDENGPSQGRMCMWHICKSLKKIYP